MTGNQTETTIDPIPVSWDHDALNRIESARFLTKYLNNLYLHETANLQRDTFVLNINAGWGHGKTFLLTNWAENLREQGFPVVFFDAWRNDYSKDPLIGFISELHEALQPWLDQVPKAKRIMKTVMKHARNIASPLAGVLGGKIAAELVADAIDSFDDAFVSDEAGSDGKRAKPDTKDISGAASKFIEEKFKEHQSIKKAIQEFRKDLGELVVALGEKTETIHLPVYVFIDELDRCRPTYAIELLEHIKHLFGVKGVYFVVATNRQQLSHAIKAVYGSSFDAGGYLRRFFDQEYELPEPDNENFALHLFAVRGMDKDKRLYSPLRNQYYSPPPRELTQIFALSSTAFGLGLRDQEQVASALNAITLVYDKPKIHLAYLVFLLMLKFKSDEAFYAVLGHAKTQNGKDFQETIRPHLNLQVTYQRPSRDRSTGRPGPSERAPLHEIFWEYVRWTFRDAKEIRNEDVNMYNGTSPIVGELQKEMPNPSFREQDYPLTISDYPKLVSQAGHLM